MVRATPLEASAFGRHDALMRRFELTTSPPREAHARRLGFMNLSAEHDDTALVDAISAAVGGLYLDLYGHDRATVSTYLNDNTVLCVLDDILTTTESRLGKFGGSQVVIDGRVAYQASTQDAFTAAIQDLTGRRVVAFLSHNQTSPGCACELFLLEPPPVAGNSPAAAR